MAKDVAADWALARLAVDLGEPLRRARSVYLGDREDAGWKELLSAVRADVDALLTEIDALR
jgi:hypothetical protein